MTSDEWADNYAQAALESVKREARNEAREEREMFAWAMEEVAKARNEALREALALSWLCFHKCNDEIEVVTADDILALMEDQSDE